MNRFYRRFLVTGVVVAGLAGCGDDVTVTEPTGRINSVTVTPDGVQVSPGQTVQMTANVNADAGVTYTVSWQSSDATRATVSNTGLVTIPANAQQGPVSIQATATASGGATASGSATLNIAAVANATVSINGITQGPNIGGAGCAVSANGTPANLQCVAGQLNVSVNLDRGTDQVVGVDLLIDDVVFGTQDFGGAPAAVKGEGPQAQAEQLLFPINTAEFDAVSGVVKLPNGVHAMKARVRTASNNQGTVSASQTITSANPSGFQVNLTNTAVSSATGSATDANGLLWTEGDVKIDVVGVIFTGGATVATVNIGVPGLSTKAGPSATWAKATAVGSGGSKDYQTAAVGVVPFISGSVLSNGQPGPVLVLNAATLLLRHDNLAPAAPTNVGTPFRDPLAAVWVNGAFAFAAGSTTAPDDLTGVQLGADAGVGGESATFWVGSALSGASGSCSKTGLTETATGADLAETTVSTAYKGRAVETDALGNPACVDLAPGGIVSNSFGADFTAPTGTLAGPADGSAANAVGATWNVSGVTDNASGFFATPLSGLITQLDGNGDTNCILGSGTNCDVEGLQSLAFDAYNGSTTDGYYTLQAMRLLDQAGNELVFATPRTYLLDQVPAAFSGGMSLQPLYTGNAAATFTTSATDNIDLNNVYGTIAYPGGTLQYPTQSIGTYGAPLEQSATVNFVVQNFIRCINGDESYAANNANKANAVNLFLSDFAQAAPTAFGAFAIPPANVQDCGDVGNIAFAGINFTDQSAPNYGAGKTAVDIDGASVAATSSTTVTLTIVADVALNTSADPYSRMEFYYLNTAGNLVKIGQATGVLAQTPTNRTYTYTFVWDPDSAVQAGAVTVLGIGVDAQGDAVATDSQAVNTVP